MNHPYTRPSVTELEGQYASDAVANGWGANYDYINRFEEKFADYLGVKHCIATSSCTGAMHIGLDAIGISPGSEVIWPTQIDSDSLSDSTLRCKTGFCRYLS